jgi:hypothetical protein
VILHVRNDSEVIVCRGLIERGNLINDATEETCIVAWSPWVDGDPLTTKRYQVSWKLETFTRGTQLGPEFIRLHDAQI